MIEDHFDRQFELELTLVERGKKADLALLSQDLPEPGTFSFTRQQSPLGLGHAVWCARELVGHEPFALLLPDVLVQHQRGCLAQMIDAAKDLDDNANIIAVEEVPADRIHMYGVVGVGAPKGKAFAITKMVEKPKRGRGAVEPDHHRPLHPAAGDLRPSRKAGGRHRRRNPAHRRHGGACAQRSRSTVSKFEGRSFDCGSKIGFLAANVGLRAGAPRYRAGIPRGAEAAARREVAHDPEKWEPVFG